MKRDNLKIAFAKKFSFPRTVLSETLWRIRQENLCPRHERFFKPEDNSILTFIDAKKVYSFCTMGKENFIGFWEINFLYGAEKERITIPVINPGLFFYYELVMCRKGT